MDTILCKICGDNENSFSPSQFNRKYPICRVCKSNQYKEYYQNKKNNKIVKRTTTYCKKCGDENQANFAPSQLKRIAAWCRSCASEYKKEYHLNNRDIILDKNKKYYLDNKDKKKEYTNNNKEKIKIFQKEYREKNKEELKISQKEYFNKNKELINAQKRERRKNDLEFLKKEREKNKEWAKNNKLKIRNTINLWKKNKRRTDPVFKLRDGISNSINLMIKKNNSSKKGQSILKYLPYTIQELKNHIEALFESWMNWSNHGAYNQKTWNDNDQSTWIWQLDHIIPQSILPYDSMEHPNFKKCWALENLRPLSAKQNFLDGVRKIRHKNAL